MEACPLKQFVQKTRQRENTVEDSGLRASIIKMTEIIAQIVYFWVEGKGKNQAHDWFLEYFK